MASSSSAPARDRLGGLSPAPHERPDGHGRTDARDEQDEHPESFGPGHGGCERVLHVVDTDQDGEPTQGEQDLPATPLAVTCREERGQPATDDQNDGDGFHRRRATRKLEVACREPLSLRWLTGLIQPDHNSLWRFWRDNKKALRAIFKQTVPLAVRPGAVGLALQALDGTKIEAAASG